MTRSFRVAIADTKQEPIPFEVGGEEFFVPRPLSGAAMLDLADMTDTEDGLKSLQGFSNFLKSTIGEAEQVRFRKALRKANLPLIADDPNDDNSLIGIVRYVVEEGSGRPTEQQSDSVVTPLNAGNTSPGAASTVG